ncbi:hypothetical protein H1Q63_35325 [Desmonostoc muscorum CCALA 125]|nr:hypothetical protein [Desmonostoc muscorum CCALA 125]
MNISKPTPLFSYATLKEKRSLNTSRVNISYSAQPQDQAIAPFLSTIHQP